MFQLHRPFLRFPFRFANQQNRSQITVSLVSGSVFTHLIIGEITLGDYANSDRCETNSQTRRRVQSIEHHIYQISRILMLWRNLYLLIPQNEHQLVPNLDLNYHLICLHSQLIAFHFTDRCSIFGYKGIHQYGAVLTCTPRACPQLQLISSIRIAITMVAKVKLLCRIVRWLCFGFTFIDAMIWRDCGKRATDSAQWWCG